MYKSAQTLSAYADMLHSIYGPSQNYAKTKYEILCHLSEVCGVAGKHILKKKDYVAAERFIPKIFGWVCALVRSVSVNNLNIEQTVLRKYPGVCPYCLSPKCSCWKLEKPNLQPERLRALFEKNSPSQRRGVGDFDVLFRGIYEHTWRGRNEDQDPISYTYIRLIEELAEVSEAVRFYHLYPENFENEVADLLSWWFALSHVLRDARGPAGTVTSELLWRAYPGHCRDCESAPCFCPQAPVRELMSKPSPSSIGEMDSLTSLRNQGSYNRDISDLGDGRSTIVFPAVCVRADVDNFKIINDTQGHSAGDEALKHIATVLRSKVRPKDRIYRVSGDEFGILMPDFTEEEAVGLLSRFIAALRSKPVRWVGPTGEVKSFLVSLSLGVAECETASDIKFAFERADTAAYESKSRGRDRVTRISDVNTGRLI
jgi:diguanylate cyclase (GGDEF)-like protein